MIKLILLGITVYLIWNLGRLILFAHKTGKAIKEEIASKRGQGREKDITSRTRIIDADSKNDR
jgi:hypothetical protein